MKITTEISPPAVPKDYSDNIEVIVSLQADENTFGIRSIFERNNATYLYFSA